MKKFTFFIGYLCKIIILISLAATVQAADELYDKNRAENILDIYAKVESLKISWHGYTLGGKLNHSQKEIAQKNPLPSTVSSTYKFKDKELNIVADSKTDRVLIVFEIIENGSQQKVRDMLGSLVIVFNDPTLSAHDKIVYWAYGENGKYSPTQFEEAKENLKNKQDTLPIIATVKLQSEVPIMEKGQDKASGRAYYIISSERLLKNRIS
ncbi:MAG: hypothetical protein HQK69_11075 [Desulfamplus sp.]|nr:hypothetical protein [Desulfamplus sp.]